MHGKCVTTHYMCAGYRKTQHKFVIERERERDNFTIWAQQQSLRQNPQVDFGDRKASAVDLNKVSLFHFGKIYSDVECHSSKMIYSIRLAVKDELHFPVNVNIEKKLNMCSAVPDRCIIYRVKWAQCSGATAATEREPTCIKQSATVGKYINEA